MKSKLLIATVFALTAIAGTVFADSAQPTTPPAPAPTQQATTTTQAPKTYPYTFICKHCGMTITVKSEADWKKMCDQCACGETNAKCLGDSKK